MYDNFQVHQLLPERFGYQCVLHPANLNSMTLRPIMIADGIMIGSAFLLLPLKDDNRANPSAYYMCVYVYCGCQEVADQRSVFALWFIMTTFSVMGHGLRSGHLNL